MTKKVGYIIFMLMVIIVALVSGLLWGLLVDSVIELSWQLLIIESVGAVAIGFTVGVLFKQWWIRRR